VGAVVNAVGLLLGLLMLVAFTGLPIWSISLCVLVAQVALAPLGALCLTLLYGDSVARKQPAAAPELLGR
jgi:hypothetical protein